MGMFTVVVDDAGNRWQFKTGFDDMQEFRIGDDVRDFRITDSRYPGEVHLQDGVYYAVHEELQQDKRKPDHWLVISMGKIVALHEEQPDRGEDELLVAQQYEFEDPDPGLWTDDQWAAQAKRDYQIKCDRRREEIACAGLSPLERVVRASTRLARNQIREEGFTRKILPAVPVEET